MIDVNTFRPEQHFGHEVQVSTKEWMGYFAEIKEDGRVHAGKNYHADIDACFIDCDTCEMSWDVHPNEVVW